MYNEQLTINNFFEQSEIRNGIKLEGQNKFVVS